MAETPAVPTLEDAVDYLEVLPAHEDASQAAAFVVVGSTDDEDFLFWTSAYGFRGAGANDWLIERVWANASIFFAIPRTRRAIQDNDFARSGLQVHEYLAPHDRVVERRDDAVTWNVGGRIYTWEPGRWTIRGTHAGVASDLVCVADAPPFWNSGPYEDVLTNRSAGYDCPIRSDGTISVGEKLYTAKRAAGTHERAVMGQGRSIIAENFRGEFQVGDCITDDARISFFQHAGHPAVIDGVVTTLTAMGRIAVDGNVHTFPSQEGLGGIHVTTLERWHDFRSGLYIPSRVHVSMAAPGAVLDLSIDYVGRGYWHYTTRSGVLVMVWLLGRATGSLHVADGHDYRIDNVLTPTRWGQTIFVSDETMSGPRLPDLTA